MYYNKYLKYKKKYINLKLLNNIKTIIGGTQIDNKLYNFTVNENCGLAFNITYLYLNELLVYHINNINNINNSKNTNDLNIINKIVSNLNVTINLDDYNSSLIAEINYYILLLMIEQNNSCIHELLNDDYLLKYNSLRHYYSLRNYYPLRIYELYKIFKYCFDNLHQSNRRIVNDIELYNTTIAIIIEKFTTLIKILQLAQINIETLNLTISSFPINKLNTFLNNNKCTYIMYIKPQ